MTVTEMDRYDRQFSLLLCKGDESWMFKYERKHSFIKFYE